MSAHNLAYQTGQGLRYDGKELLPRRISNQNVVYRLFHRQTHAPRPGTHFHQVRSLYTNVFPNYTVVNVEKPPCFLRKFSPDGKYFIAFSSDQTSLEIYSFQVKFKCFALFQVPGESMAACYFVISENQDVSEAKGNTLVPVVDKTFIPKSLVNKY